MNQLDLFDSPRKQPRKKPSRTKQTEDTFIGFTLGGARFTKKDRQYGESIGQTVIPMKD